MSFFRYTGRVIRFAGFACSLLALIFAGCSGDSSSLQQNSTEKGWVWSYELDKTVGKTATEDHTIVFNLKPSDLAAANANGRAVKQVPYTFKRAGKISYCVAQNDPLFIGFSLLDSTGAAVLSVKPGECREYEQQASSYTAVIEYRTDVELPANGTLAFIGREKKTTAISSDSVSSGWQALLDPAGNVMTLSPNTPINKHDNYFWVSRSLAAKGGQIQLSDLVHFVAIPGSSYSYYLHSRSQGGLGGYLPVSCDKLSMFCPPKDTGYGKCDPKVDVTVGHIDALSAQGPLYTYSSESKGTPPLQAFTVLPYGANSFWLNLSVLYSAYSANLSIGLSSDATACYSNYDTSVAPITSFTPWFRYYEDAGQTPDPVPVLKEGEVALFTGVNYTGKVYAFTADIKDFGQVEGLAGIRSVKVGPNTRVSLFAVANSQDYTKGWYSGGSIADLSKTNVGISAKSMYRSLDITKITLSSGSCRYCDLTGIQIPEGIQASNLDFSGATLTNAYFSGVLLTSINFSDALLTGATFTNRYSSSQTTLDRVDFTRANLNNTVFSKGASNIPLQMRNVTFTDALLQGTVWTEVYGFASSLARADFSGARLTNADFECTTEQCLGDSAKRINLSNAAIVGINNGAFVINMLKHNSFAWSRYFNLKGTRFTGVFDMSGNVGNADFSGAVFASGMDFSRITQSCADMQQLSGCLNLSGVVAPGATFKGANLKGANLSNMNFQNTDLSATNFSSANLAGANMSGTTLAGAQFNNANLDGAKLCNAKLNGDIPASLNSAFLRNVLLSNAQLGGVNFANANMYGDLTLGTNICQPSADECGAVTPSTCASLNNAVLANTNFTNAFLANVDFGAAEISGTLFSIAILINANFKAAKFSNIKGVTSGDLTNAWLHSADFSNASMSYFNLTNAWANNDYAPNSATSCYVVQLPAGNTRFSGYWGTAGQPSCLKLKPTQNTRIPSMSDNSVTCPDGSKGPCSASSWYYNTPDQNRFSSSLHCVTLPKNCSVVDLNW